MEAAGAIPGSLSNAYIFTDWSHLIKKKVYTKKTGKILLNKVSCWLGTYEILIMICAMRIGEIETIKILGTVKNFFEHWNYNFFRCIKLSYNKLLLLIFKHLKFS